MPKSIANELENSRVLIYGIDQNEEIKARIAEIYSQDRIKRGMTLYQNAKSAHVDNGLKEKDLRQANRIFKEAKKFAHQKLMRIREVGRYYYGDDDEFRSFLRFNEKIPTNFAGWKSLANASVDAVLQNPAVQEKFALINLNSEEMMAMKELLINVDKLKLDAHRKNGEAQYATALKKDAMKELLAYCKDLRACLRLFYRGNERQTLEEVGIIVRS